MRLLLILAFIIINWSVAFADMGPKFTERATLEFYFNNKQTTDFDSICAIVNSSYQCDTATIHNTTAQYWTQATLDRFDDKYQIVTQSDIKSFTVILFKNQKKYESKLIKHYPGNSIYRFDVSQGLYDISPLLHIEWFKYFLSLLITIIVEFFICTPFFIKYKRPSLKAYKFVATFILINIFTHFSLWYIYSHFTISIVILEILAILVELIYWRKLLQITIKKALLVSFLANLGSWMIGGLINLLIF